MRKNDNGAVISVRFGELWLRGRNRGRFIKALMRNLSERLMKEDLEISREYDRILISPEKAANLERIMAKLSTVFGISRFEVAHATAPDMKSIKKLSSELMSGAGKGHVLRIQSHRSYKQHKFNSVDIVSELLKTAKKMGIDVSNKDYDTDLSVNVTKDRAFISTQRQKGAGGLPVGSGGKAIVLLSGGIDSPVAAWYAMKRGMSPVYVHFHGFPNNNAKELKKIKALADRLSEYYPHYRMYIIPASQFQVSALSAGRSETVLLKHFMLLAADRIAEIEGSHMIYTGDCLGQVSSQTPQNLLSEGQGIRCAVARPLIGFDKEEIIGIAKRIGTYEMSLQPYHDVCSINARNPSTDVSEELIKVMAKKMKLDGMAAKAVKSAKIIDA